MGSPKWAGTTIFPPRHRRAFVEHAEGAPASVRRQRGTKKGHVVPREDRSNGGTVRVWSPRDRTEFLVELVPAAGDIDHNDLGLLSRQIEEGMWDLSRQIGEAARFEDKRLVAAADLEAAF